MSFVLFKTGSLAMALISGGTSSSVPSLSVHQEELRHNTQQKHNVKIPQSCNDVIIMVSIRTGNIQMHKVQAVIKQFSLVTAETRMPETMVIGELLWVWRAETESLPRHRHVAKSKRKPSTWNSSTQ